MKKAIAALAIIAALIAAILMFSSRFKVTEHIYVEWNGERVGIRGEGSAGLKWTIDRGFLTMTANETVGKSLKIHLSGECANGQFELTAAKRTFILLEGLKLLNPTGAALVLKGDKSTYLTLADNTENTLGDAGIEAAGDLTIGGDGSLTIVAQGTGHKGINIDGNLKIKDDPTITITTSGQPEHMQVLPCRYGWARVRVSLESLRTPRFPRTRPKGATFRTFRTLRTLQNPLFFPFHLPASSATTSRAQPRPSRRRAPFSSKAAPSRYRPAHRELKASNRKGTSSSTAAS